MLKAIKNFFQKRKQLKLQKAQMKKAQVYYKLIQSGGMFLKYVDEDLKKQESGMNRAGKRRFRREIAHEGKFSREIVERYQDKVDNVLEYIELKKEALKAKREKKNESKV